MTAEQQAELIYQACKEVGLDGHISWIDKKCEAQTWAERIAVRFKGTEQLPVKNSYMYCDKLDMCFFYGPQDTPQMAYAGYVTAASSDITEGKLIEAFRKANTVLQAMQRLAKEEKSNGQN